MLEQKVNILSEEILNSADAVCFTANGIVKNDGTLVMGAGIAKTFAIKFPWLPAKVGKNVKEFGNRVYSFWNESNKVHIISFPTKYHWRNPSSLDLIRQSAEDLMAMINENNWQRVYLPCPGCGNGGLNYEKQVKPLLKNILDDRVIICFK